MTRSACPNDSVNPIIPEQEESKDVIELAKYLRRTQRQRDAYLVGPDRSRVKIPSSMHSVLLRAAEALANEAAVSIVPVHHELTTQQAADLLMVSRPRLIKMLENGEMPFSKVGTHRRIRFDDLMRYRERRQKRRQEMLDQLAEEDAKLGI